MYNEFGLEIITKPYAMLIFYSNSFCLATSQMIGSHSVSSGLDYVKLNWTHPMFQPETYQLKYVCTLKPKCTPDHDTNNYIMAKTENISVDTTFVTISNLHPSSNCLLFLLARYNPASLDTGIAIFGTTLDEDARGISSGLHHFMITAVFVNCFLYMYAEQQTTSIIIDI